MAERQADRQNAPSQSVQASDRSKAEGERDTERDARDAPQPDGRDAERSVGRDAGRDALRTGRGGLDPTEVRDVLAETSERHRRGEDVGASGTSDPTLAEREEQQAEVPPRTRKTGGGT
jgi:hypothetical protein